MRSEGANQWISSSRRCASCAVADTTARGFSSAASRARAGAYPEPDRPWIRLRAGSESRCINLKSVQLYRFEFPRTLSLAVFALIPAAGAGTRLAGEAPKQYRALAGHPMLWHAIRAVCVPPVESVFVVLAPEDKTFAAHDWSAFAGKLEPLFCGGATRRDSVYNGLVAAMAGVDA